MVSAAMGPLRWGGCDEDVGGKIPGKAGPVVALALMAGLAGCGTTEQLGGASASGGSSFSDRISRMFASRAPAPEPAPEDKDKAAKVEYECPAVTIRTGAAAYPVFATGRDQVQALRYQATIGQTARECAALGQAMTMKVGIEGRLLAGPAGGPGKVDIPMRIAVVQEGPTPKTIWSRFYRVPVQMPDGAGPDRLPARRRGRQLSAAQARRSRELRGLCRVRSQRQTREATPQAGPTRLTAAPSCRPFWMAVSGGAAPPGCRAADERPARCRAVRPLLGSAPYDTVSGRTGWRIVWQVAEKSPFWSKIFWRVWVPGSRMDHRKAI